MDTPEQSKFSRLMLGVFVASALAACSEEKVVCGGDVQPQAATGLYLRILDVAKDESAEFCSGDDAGCDFEAYKTRDGATVRVTRVVAWDGRCSTNIGDERFYTFDASGRFERVIMGL